MSAASRKNDPFNFDDIYRQAGVEDLFVKKTLGELKHKQTSPGPAPAASTARPVAASTQAPRTDALNFDLDFLTTVASPARGAPPAKHVSTASHAAPSIQQQQQLFQAPAPAAAPIARPPLDDPFAFFEEVPGAAPAQRHTPRGPAAAPTSGLGNLLDFDDGHAFPSSAPTVTTALVPAAPIPSPVSAAAARPPPPLFAEEPQRQPQHLQSPAAPSRPSPAASLPQPAPQAAPQAAPAPPPSPPPPPPPDYSEHADHYSAPPGPAQWSHGSVNPSSSTQPQHPAAPSYASEWHQDHPSSQSTANASSQPSYSSFSSPVTHGSSGAGSSGGISGYLKAFGKKAVRAAKAGIAQLEHALEGLDQTASGLASSAQQHPQHYPGSSPYSSAGGRSHDDGADISNDEALAWAVRLADLAPHAQQQELAHMAPPLRRKVIEVLREQIRVEHEAANQADLGAGVETDQATGQGQARPSHFENDGAAATSYGLGVGHGHGHGLALEPQPALGLGHGHGAPASPPPPYRGSQDGGYAPLGAERQMERDRAVAGGAAATPVGAGEQPMARQPSQPAPAHDLLGMGSMAGGAGSDNPAAAAAVAAAPVPVVEDLLGLGDDHHAGGTHATSAAAPVPAAPAVTPPRAVAVTAPAPAPAPVHMDDMDDFFSGGSRPSGSGAAAAQATAASPGGAAAAFAAGRAASGAMHTSSSTASLRGRGSSASIAAMGVGGGSSSNAASLGDFLHDELGSGGGGGAGANLANLDVSGYEDLYRGEQGDANEPELRRRLREQREAAKHAKMKAALAEKLAMEAEEAARREQQVVLKDQYKANIEVWKNKNKGNIRGLLGSLHTVLWADSSWAPVSVADLLEPAQIKKVYMRANLLVHPDKVRQRNGTADQVAIADMIFDVLKDAWNAFR